MDKRRLPNTDHFAGGLPPDLPSVDEGWSNMRQKLDTQMPDKVLVSPGNKAGKKTTWKKYTLLVLLLITATVAGIVMNDDNSQQQTGLAHDIAKSEEIRAKNNLPGNSDNTGSVKTVTSSTTLTDVPPTAQSVDETIRNNDSDNKNAQIISGKRTAYFNTPNSTRNKNVGRAKSTTKSGPGRKSQKPVPIDATDGETATPANPELNDVNNAADTASIDSASIKAEVIKLTDSAVSNTPEGEPEDEMKFDVGLYWSVQIPTYSGSDFFTGGNGASQFYRVLLPGFFLRSEIGRSAFIFELNPFYSNLLPSEPFLTTVNTAHLSDTVVITTEIRSLRKTFGVSSGISYEYNLRHQWWIGGGLQWTILRNGVARIEAEEERRALNGSGETTRYYDKSYVLPQSEWDYFQKTYLGINGHLLYKSKRWQSGLRITFPMTPLAKREGPEFPLRSELFFRFPVFQFKGK